MICKMMMRSGYDDLDISVLAVIPERDPKAVLQIAHGMCGCKERFLPVMEYMASNGIACVAGDHRGHGGSVKSSDDLGYMYAGGYHALVADMRMITEWAHDKYPDVPVYLLGHSMGSMAARVYTKWNDSSIDGLILCGSPSWTPLSHVGRLMAGLLCRVGLSRMRMEMMQRLTSAGYNIRFVGEGPQAWTCSDAVSREKTASGGFGFTANGSHNMLCLMRETYRKGEWTVSKPHMPIYFISGEDDPVMISESRFHEAAQNLCDRGYTNVTSAIYPGMRHEVLNEIGKEAVWRDILAFMTR